MNLLFKFFALQLILFVIFASFTKSVGIARISRRQQMKLLKKMALLLLLKRNKKVYTFPFPLPLPFPLIMKNQPIIYHQRIPYPIEVPVPIPYAEPIPYPVEVPVNSKKRLNDGSKSENFLDEFDTYRKASSYRTKKTRKYEEKRNRPKSVGSSRKMDRTYSFKEIVSS